MCLDFKEGMTSIKGQSVSFLHLRICKIPGRKMPSPRTQKKVSKAHLQRTLTAASGTTEIKIPKNTPCACPHAGVKWLFQFFSNHFPHTIRLKEEYQNINIYVKPNTYIGLFPALSYIWIISF